VIDERALRQAFAALQAEVRALRRRVAELEVESGTFASAEALTRRGGDPIVKFDPSGWRGESQKEKAFSACPPAFLDTMADALRYMALQPPKEAGKDFRGANLRNAALARTWARKLRAAEAARARAAAPPATSSPDEDFIP
jgi:hypothetical protein